jgi:hypothetical protein
MMDNIEIRTVRFTDKIGEYELPLFRGAIIKRAGMQEIFHNHVGDSRMRYGYPLIQYKRIDGRAAIVGLGDGAEALEELIRRQDYVFELGKRLVSMELLSDKVEETAFEVEGEEGIYDLALWLPLNEENYEEYKRREKEGGRIEMLERILTGNILSMLKGVGRWTEERLEVSIIRIKRVSKVRVKGCERLAFDVTFRSNVRMPQWIGLGKNVSLGYGILTKQE